MPYEASDWVCVNAECPEQGVVKHGEAPPEAEVRCGTCQQRCDYSVPS